MDLVWASVGHDDDDGDDVATISQPNTSPPPHHHHHHHGRGGRLFVKDLTGAKKLEGTCLPDEEIREEDLRKMFLKNWKATHKEFCIKYEIDPSNFNAWLNGKRKS